MENFLENILNIKIEINYSFQGIKLKNEKLENKYLDSKSSSYLILRIITVFFFSFIYVGLLLYLSRKTRHKSTLLSFSFDLTLGLAITDTISNLLIFSKLKFFQNRKRIDYLIVVRGLIILANCIYYSLEEIFEDKNSIYFFRNMYMIIIIKNILNFLSCPNSLHLNILFCLINSAFIATSHYILMNSLLSLNFAIDIFVEVISSLIIVLLERIFEISERSFFGQKFLIDNFYLYFEDILASLKCFHFSFKNQKLLYYNKLTNVKIFEKNNNNKNVNNKSQTFNVDVKLESNQYFNVRDENETVLAAKNIKKNEAEKFGFDDGLPKSCPIEFSTVKKINENFELKNNDYETNNQQTKINNERINSNMDDCFNKNIETNQEKKVETCQAALFEKMKKFIKLTLNQNFDILQTNNNNPFDNIQIRNLYDFYESLINNCNYYHENSNSSIKIIPKNKISRRYDEDIFRLQTGLLNKNSNSGFLNKFNKIGEDDETVKEKILSYNRELEKLNKKSFGKNINDNKNNIQDINYKFTYLGEFFCEDEEQGNKSEKYDCHKNKYYKVYFRKIFEVIEFIIFDKTKSKILEISSIEKRVKQNLFAKIAHEFKTPLNSIISLINNIKTYVNFENIECNHNINSCLDAGNNVYNTYSINKSLKQDLNTITGLSNYTMFLISDIISYYNSSDKNKPQDIEVSLEFVSLKKIMNFNFEILKALISCNENKAQNIQPSFAIEDCLLNCKIKTDEYRLNQMILNLISNAVKFTKTGEIKITATLKMPKVEAKELDENFMTISIEDSGMGIKRDQQKFIFCESEEINLNYELNKFGSGLGLSICKSIANKLNYKIKFSSIEDKGTKFDIDIPINFEMFLSRDSEKDVKLGKIITNSMKNQFDTASECNYQIISKNNESSLLQQSDPRDFLKSQIPCYKKDLLRKFYLGSNELDLINIPNITKRKSVFTTNLNHRNKKNMSHLGRTNPYDNYSKDNSENETIVNNNILQLNYMMIKEYSYQKSLLECSVPKSPEKSSRPFLFRIEKSKSLEDNSTIFYNSKKNSEQKEFFIPNYEHNLSPIFQNKGQKISNRINTNLQLLEEMNDSNNIIEEKLKKDADGKLLTQPKTGEMNRENYQTLNNDVKSENSENTFSIFNYNHNLVPSIISGNNFNLSNRKEDERSRFAKAASHVGQKSKKITKLFTNNFNNNHNQKVFITTNNFVIMPKNYKFQKINSFTIASKCNTFEENFRPLNPRNGTEHELVYNEQVNNSSSKINYVLIVDDNRHIRSCMKNMLEKILIEKKLLQYYYILEGNDGIDILKYVIDAKYSQKIKMILTDENMEYMHGSIAIKIIREYEKLNKVKKYNIFSVTSYEDKISEKKILTAGADSILNKPFSKEKLLQILESYNLLEN